MNRHFFRNSALLSVLALGGCDVEAKPLPDDKKEYAGTWAGQDMKLVIQPNGRVEYERDGTTITGPIQKYEGADFVVGAFGLSTTFDVEEVPHQVDDGSWQMKVDGVDLVRINVAEILQQVADPSNQ